MATKIGDLVVRVGTDSQDFKKDMQHLKRELGGLGDKVAGVAGKVAGFGAAVVGTTAAISAYVGITADAIKETQNLARRAGTSVQTFQAVAFAFKQAGIDSEGTAAALNDVSERVAEFAAIGSGPFQDFSDIMGLSATEARDLARDLQNLSGEGALLEMSKQMQDAGVNSAQMNFVLKSMSGELEKVSGLLANNGEELDRLKGKYSDLTGQLQLSATQAEDVKKVSEAFDLVTDSIGLASQQLVANLAPEFVQFFGWVAENVPIAANAVIDFVNSLKDVEARNNIDSLERALAKNLDRIKQINTELQKEKDLNWAKMIMEEREKLEAQNKTYTDQIALLKEKEAALAAVEARATKGLEFGTGGKTGGKADEESAENAKRLEQERQFQAEMQQIVDDAHVWYMEQQGAKHLEKMEAKRLEDEEFKAMIADGEKWHYEQLAKAAQQRIDQAKDEAAQRSAAMDTMMTDLASLMNSGSRKMFEIGKAAAISETVINTWSAAQKQFDFFSETNPPLAYAAAAAAIAAGITRVQAISSRQFGKGGMGSGGAGGSVPSVQNQGEVIGGQTGGNVTYVQGLNPNDLFSGEQVVSLINEAQENGARLVIL